MGLVIDPYSSIIKCPEDESEDKERYHPFDIGLEHEYIGYPRYDREWEKCGIRLTLHKWIKTPHDEGHRREESLIERDDIFPWTIGEHDHGKDEKR